MQWSCNTSLSAAGQHSITDCKEDGGCEEKWWLTHSLWEEEQEGMFLCVCVCVCVCVCARARMCVCVCVCVCLQG